MYAILLILWRRRNNAMDKTRNGIAICKELYEAGWF